MKSTIRIQNLRKQFRGHDIFKNLSLEVQGGAITALFGPNGCGKSTLLNILAGIAVPDGGTCTIDGGMLKRMSYVFQNYRESLLPWRTNFANLTFPLEIRGVHRTKIHERISHLEKQFDCSIDRKRYPYESSGGQQQILALLRALVSDPVLLFLDEPFAALDYETSIRLRLHFQAYITQLQPTVLLVSHQVEEAVQLAEQIIILGENPTTIVAVIENPLPYPRTMETMRSTTFHDVKNRVLTAFQRAAHL